MDTRLRMQSVNMLVMGGVSCLHTNADIKLKGSMVDHPPKDIVHRKFRVVDRTAHFQSYLGTPIEESSPTYIEQMEP